MSILRSYDLAPDFSRLLSHLSTIQTSDTLIDFFQSISLVRRKLDGLEQKVREHNRRYDVQFPICILVWVFSYLTRTCYQANRIVCSNWKKALSCPMSEKVFKTLAPGKLRSMRQTRYSNLEIDNVLVGNHIFVSTLFSGLTVYSKSDFTSKSVMINHPCFPHFWWTAYEDNIYAINADYVGIFGSDGQLVYEMENDDRLDSMEVTKSEIYGFIESENRVLVYTKELRLLRSFPFLCTFPKNHAPVIIDNRIFILEKDEIVVTSTLDGQLVDHWKPATTWSLDPDAKPHFLLHIDQFLLVVTLNCQLTVFTTKGTFLFAHDLTKFIDGKEFYTRVDGSNVYLIGEDSCWVLELA